MSGDDFNPPIDGAILIGDDDNNILIGTPFNDQISGLGGNDRLFGRAGSDLLEGGIGHDKLFGGDGEDKLVGGMDNDKLFGQRNDDWLFGGDGHDKLFGDGGNDDLNGGDGRDLLFGGFGNDTVDGGLGNDFIRLGPGSDVLVLAPGNGFDTVKDFRDGHDKIQLDGGLTFDDLKILSQGRKNTLIRINKPGDPNDGEKLALLKGVRRKDLDIDDFIIPNQAPNAVDDKFTTDENTILNENVLTNDSDPDAGDILTVTEVDGVAANVGSQITLSSGALVTLNSNGTLAYDPNGAFDSLNTGDTALDSFTYQIGDGNGGFDTATVKITIEGITDNLPPAAVDDSFTTDEDTLLSGDVLAANPTTPDSDPDGDPITVTEVNGVAADVGTQITLTSGALLTLNSDGTFDYDPNGAFESLNTGETDTDSFTYTIDDGNGGTDMATVTITIEGVTDNSPPVAQDQSYSTFGNTLLEVAGADFVGDVASVTDTTNLLTGATDPDVGDVLSTLAETKATTEGGTVMIFSDGSFFYIPEAGDTGIDDTFTFTVLDGNGGTDMATATITLSDRIWYVDDSAAPGGDGTSANPLNSLAPLDTGGASDGLDGTGDTIYVLDGTYTSGITLEDNQSLLGQAVDLVVDSTTLITGSPANRPDITGNVALASGNTVQGIDLNGNIIGTNVGNLTVEDVVFSNSESRLDVINTTNNATLNILNNTLTPASPTGTNLTRFEIDNDGNNAVVNITGNTIDRGTSSGDALRFENSGTGVTATISNNDVDASGFSTGTGIEVLNQLSGTQTLLLTNNTVDGTGSFHILVDSEDNGTITATVTNNSVPTGVAPSIANNASLALNAEDNATLNVSVTGNDMQGDNGNTGGGSLPFEADILFIDSGAGAVVNVAQASAAAVTALNNGDTVGTFGTVNFGVPLP